MCMHAYVSVRAYVVRACACEGIEDALPLGVFPLSKRGPASQAVCPPYGP